MFGINDNNQQNGPQADNGTPADSSPHLPPSPFMDTPADSRAPMPMPSPSPEPSSAPAMAEPPSQVQSSGLQDDGLVNLKEQALSSLAPLVSHLDQTPEEKFKTTMMLIQASDNSSLIKDAYEAANQLPDEKARAQALLDVVNEINYFTQKDKNKS